MRLIRSFGVYRAPLNSVWSARACFGNCIALLLSLLWEPSWPLWSTWQLGAHFRTPGSPSGRLRGVSGQHWRFCVHRRPFASRGLSSTAPAHKNRPAGICIRIFKVNQCDVQSGARTAVQDLPSTRAGDQDDVSFTNSLKLRTLSQSPPVHPTT